MAKVSRKIGITIEFNSIMMNHFAQQAFCPIFRHISHGFHMNKFC